MRMGLQRTTATGHQERTDSMRTRFRIQHLLIVIAIVAAVTWAITSPVGFSIHKDSIYGSYICVWYGDTTIVDLNWLQEPVSGGGKDGLSLDELLGELRQATGPESLEQKRGVPPAASRTNN